MDNLADKIYDKIIREEPDAIEASKKTDAEILKLIAENKDALESTDSETLKSLMYQAADLGRQEGFRLGVHFAYKLITG